MTLALVVVGLLVCTTIVYTVLSGLIVGGKEPSRTFAEVNLALALISLLFGAYLAYAILSASYPQGLLAAWRGRQFDKVDKVDKVDRGVRRPNVSRFKRRA